MNRRERIISDLLEAICEKEDEMIILKYLKEAFIEGLSIKDVNMMMMSVIENQIEMFEDEIEYLCYENKNLK